MLVEDRKTIGTFQPAMVDELVRTSAASVDETDAGVQSRHVPVVAMVITFEPPDRSTAETAGHSRSPAIVILLPPAPPMLIAAPWAAIEPPASRLMMLL